MLYIAFVKARSQPAAGVTVEDLSRRWWNEGERPAGLQTVAIFGSLGTSSPDVFVFEASSHDDIQAMVTFWSRVADIDVHPATDLAEAFRRQGMNVA
jgi:hypothetical protein